MITFAIQDKDFEFEIVEAYVTIRQIIYMQTGLTSVEKSYITATCKSQHNDTYDVALTVLLDIAENKTCIHWNSTKSAL